MSRARRPLRQANWLKGPSSPRARPWALQELLFGRETVDEIPPAPVRRSTIDVPSGDPALEEDYRLGHCQGFAAVDLDESIGIVTDVRFLSRVDRPDELEVTIRGRFHRRSVWIPVDHVEEVSPELEQITLACRLRETSPSRLRTAARALSTALRRPSPT